jgi:hypothetical protein
MEKLSKFKNLILSDQNALSINGGDDCNGTQTKKTQVCGSGIFSSSRTTYDWEDEGCCE